VREKSVEVTRYRNTLNTTASSIASASSVLGGFVVIALTNPKVPDRRMLSFFLFVTAILAIGAVGTAIYGLAFEPLMPRHRSRVLYAVLAQGTLWAIIQFLLTGGIVVRLLRIDA
jgi:hypothetical protein